MNGITFLGKHSYKDLGITMSPERGIGIPNKMKNKHRVPFSNVTYDFSRLYGEETYEERTLTYNFNIGGIRVTKEQMVAEKTKIVNWLMHSDGKQALYDDTIPGWHFLAEVEGGMAFQENWRTGILTVTFIAYPFMIRDVNEGDDIWDTFNFDYDVSQIMSATSSMGTFKELAIGSYATVGAYATHYDGWESISRSRIGTSRKILSIQPTTQGSSKRAYELEGIEGLVLEQDLVQSRVSPTRITLINNGAVGVMCEVTTNNKISIVKGNTVYNIFPGTTKDPVFKLDVGINELEITSIYDTNIKFAFYKELI